MVQHSNGMQVSVQRQQTQTLILYLFILFIYLFIFCQFTNPFHQWNNFCSYAYIDHRIPITVSISKTQSFSNFFRASFRLVPIFAVISNPFLLAFPQATISPSQLGLIFSNYVPIFYHVHSRYQSAHQKDISTSRLSNKKTGHWRTAHCITKQPPFSFLAPLLGLFYFSPPIYLLPLLAVLAKPAYFSLLPLYPPTFSATPWPLYTRVDENHTYAFSQYV